MCAQQHDVAVLMAVYDGVNPTHLRDAVESILHQTYRKLDLQIFLDGVTRPELVEMLSRYRDQHGNVVLRAHERNRGLAICLNEMIELLRDRYEYFARMDADDLAYPERIENQVAFLQTHPQVDILGGSIVDISEDGKPLRKVEYPVTHEEILRVFRVRSSPMAHVTVMFRRSYFDRAGLYPPVALEDSLYWAKGFLAGCRFHNLPESLVMVRRSHDFLRRRSGLRKQWAELMIKFTINRQLGFGLASYLYATGIFLIQLMPSSIKRLAYDWLR